MTKQAERIDPAGDSVHFDKNWNSQKEAYYLHWTRNEPKNQIQFAFRQHWKSFQPFIKKLTGRRCLEVGCGRGSMSAYFADAGWDCTLLDISPKAIKLARDAFSQQQLTASFDVGDCLKLPYEDEHFDLCFSIGLLEHFQDFHGVIQEQARVLAKGGLFIGYIVPHIPDNIQKEYNWICDLLKATTPPEASAAKTEIYRSDALSAPYLNSMKNNGLRDLFHSGIYPLPMISHSIEFPFTLLTDEAESILVDQFTRILKERKQQNDGQDPWLCYENYGQAVLVCGYKPDTRRADPFPGS